MKIKEGFILREIAGTYIVFNLKNTMVELDGILSMNASGALLWNCLDKGCTMDILKDALIQKYDVSEDRAMKDAEVFVAKLLQIGCIEE